MSIMDSFSVQFMEEGDSKDPATPNPKGKKETQRSLWQVFGNASMILIFLMYQTIVTQCIRTFRCTALKRSDVPNDHMLIMTHDSRVDCDGLYYELHTAVAVAGLCLYGVLLPLFTMILVLWQARKQGWITANTQFSFLIKGFRLRFWFWEFVIVSRKVFIRLLLSLVTEPVQQALIGIWLLTVLFVVQTFAKPYVKTIHNHAEQLSLMSALITLNIGLAFKTQEAVTGERCCTLCGVFSVLVVAVNALVMGFFLLQIGLGVYDRLVEKYGIDLETGQRWISLRNMRNHFFAVAHKEEKLSPTFTTYTPRFLNRDVAKSLLGELPEDSEQQLAPLEYRSMDPSATSKRNFIVNQKISTVEPQEGKIFPLINSPLAATETRGEGEIGSTKPSALPFRRRLRASSSREGQFLPPSSPAAAPCEEEMVPVEDPAMMLREERL